MELLSPAGSPEALLAAVQNGADAVYMGLGSFNARRSARNFTDDTFPQAVDYCHRHGVKVYQACIHISMHIGEFLKQEMQPPSHIDLIICIKTVHHFHNSNFFSLTAQCKRQFTAHCPVVRFQGADT